MVTAARTTSTIFLHMTVAFLVMWTTTGSAAFGGIAALVEPLCVVAIAPFHEKAWQLIEQRLARRAAMQDRLPAAGSPALVARFHPAPAARH